MFVLCFDVQIGERPENDGYVNKRSRKLVYLDLHFHFFSLLPCFRFFHCFIFGFRIDARAQRAHNIHGTKDDVDVVVERVIVSVLNRNEDC